ncbi:beta-ketoacyl synthase N-terminal-like domain-containing protein [Streptomyces sp. NPDC048751]|uniref:beta-ketoacyl synthase N-terminal-like domain-containing protein n=1 Tax=Streptomyces sp. NPDC048751 TaxID=3365591 RepID=UPI00371AD71C
MSTAVRAEPVSRPIVGMGAVAATGSDLDELFESLCLDGGGRPEVRAFDPSRSRARYASPVDGRPVPGADLAGRATRLLLDAVGQAAADAGLGEDLSGVPVLVGTGVREPRPLELWWRDGSPFADSGLDFGTALRERFGVEVTHTFSNACSASLYALALAFDLLGQEGDDALDTVIVAGVDVASGSLPDSPLERTRPFGADDRCVSPGDGAAAIVLRRADCPAARVHGRLRGVAFDCDDHGPTALSADQIAAVMRTAHRLAGVKASDVDLVMLDGRGPSETTTAEAFALATVLGDAASAPLMTAVESTTGQPSGASGLLGLIVGIRALNQGRARDGQRLNLAQLNAFGLGGINAVAIVEGTERS